MKRSPRVRLSSVVKRALLPLSIFSLALLLLGSPALATTPIAVDMYQDMESGNAGDVLTSTIMNASSHGQAGWAPASGTMWVSTGYHRDLPGPVIAGGVTYNGTGGTRSWTFADNNAVNFVHVNAGWNYPEVTTACYYTPGTTLVTQTVGYDTINMTGGGTFACFQTITNSNGASGLNFHLHSEINYTIGTNEDPVAISVTPLKTYWVCVNYSSSVAHCACAAYDPDNGYAQVGTTLYVTALYNANMADLWMGRTDNHGDKSYDMSYSYFDQVLVDHTNAAFPLLPSGANDTTSPSAPPAVRDGTGADQSIALSTTQLSANWDMAVDAESGIKGYQYAIGTTQGGTNVVNWTTLINVRGVTKTGLSLTTGQTYYFSVKAQNGVGLWGPATNSNGQTVGTDTTPPSAPPAVRDGGYYNYVPDIDTTASSNELECNFDYATDNESGISGYQYAFGTTPGGTDVFNWTNLPATVQNGWATGLNLPVGVRYYATVRTVNNAGLTSPATNSDGQIVADPNDTTPPSAPPAVRDGTGADISTQTSTTQLSANWDASTDNQSGIEWYWYCIGTTPGNNNILNWTQNTANYISRTATVTGLSLSVGQTYYFTVQANNGVGLASAHTSSNGVTIVSGTDSTPPSAPPTVRDGTGADISTTGSTTQLSANWDASTDNESGISGYQYAIGTSAGGTQTVNFTSLGNVTTVTKTGLTLTVGQTYFFSVKAVNGAGLTGSATNSNGQTVVGDSTPPSAPPNVRDGVGADISTTSSTTQLSANWDASTDNESGISGYQYAIGTSAGGTQTVNFTSLGNVTTVTKTGLTLTVGQTYYFSVKAVNGAGLTGSATNSNGQTVVDVTPPSAPPTVRDGTGTDISTTSSTTQLSANWDASTDNESGISGYQYAIGTSAGGTQTVNFTSLGNVTTVTKTGLTLTVGQTYFFSVKAVNGAGLTGIATNSNGQAVVSSSSVIYFQDNFESWTVHGGAWSSVSGETSTHTLNTSTDYAKAGAKGLELTDSDTTATSGACLVKNFSPAISGDIYVRFFMFFPTGYESTNTGCRRRVLRVWCESNRAQMSFQDDAPIMEEVGAWGGVTGSAISEGAWHCIEMHGATPSASTAMQFWVDGISAGTLNGSFSGSTAWDHMEFGDVVLGNSTNGTGTFYLDELVVSNSYVGTGITSPVTYFSDNFENWTVHGGAWSSVSGESSSHTLNTSTDQARSGTKSLKLTDTDTTGVYGACLVKNFSPTISGDIYVRFYVFLPTGYGSTNQNGMRRILGVWSSSNRIQMSTKNGTMPALEEIGAWGQADGSALSENQWHCIEVHSTVPSANMAVEFYVDGVRNSMALTANFGSDTTWNYMDFGDVAAGGGTNGTGTFYLDETVVSNSYNGPLP